MFIARPWHQNLSRTTGLGVVTVSNTANILNNLQFSNTGATMPEHNKG
jgi:hypothetical protein